jgi:two-component system, OmpR family, alkaline phosphatase synthesis response regulator PhoP
VGQKILVVEDEPGIRLAIKDELEFEGFDVVLAEDGPSGVAAIASGRPDLIVLDLMLPGRNGFQICQDLRAQGNHTPIIVITARSQESDKVRGLELGADDYVTKPLSLAELLARVRAVLRRTARTDDRESIEVPPIRIDFRRHSAFKNGIELALTDTEFQILALLMRRAGEVITRDDFLKQIWGEEVYVTHRTVDTHVASLRKKIEDDLEHPAFILSVRNVGYRFHENVAAS